MTTFLTLLINILLITVTVGVHYEILHRLSVVIPKLSFGHRFRVLASVFGTIFAHILEVVVFGLAFYFMIKSNGFGDLQGNFEGSLRDCIYFSFTNYTTLGYGDIEPSGNLRFVAGVEAITGLSLITWSASFVFVEMTRFWDTNRGHS